MQRSKGTWALLLAGGEGRRLSGLSTDRTGRVVPKQYCSLHGGPSLLRCAIERALSVTDPERICIIVAEEHRRWWWPLVQEFPAQNIVVQPRNRGTANGVLLQLLQVTEGDPDADVIVLPSDHFVGEEEILIAAMQQAVQRARAAPQQIVLLGMAPMAPDPELGYIVAGRQDGEGIRQVITFVEKPAVATAALLIKRGALLNTFILAARCTALLELFARVRPEALKSMREAMDFHKDRRAALAALYERLPVLDFSGELLANGRGSGLRVLAVPECGWNDLGTPERLGRTLMQFEGAGWQAVEGSEPAAAAVDLAENYWRAVGQSVPELRATA
jgi:mannose-1-phosphate guanylyltransferase